MITILDLNARNPLSPLAIGLWDVQEHKNYASWDTCTRTLTFLRFTSTWSVQTPHVAHDIPESELYSRCVARGIQVPKPLRVSKCFANDVILLDNLGITPYGSGLWSERAFTIPATPAGLAGLDGWLKARGEEGISPALMAGVELAKQENISPWYGRLVTELAEPYVSQVSLAS